MRSMLRNTVSICLSMLFSGSVTTFSQTVVPRTDSSFNSVGFIHIDDYYSFLPTVQVIQADEKILVGGYGNITAGAPDLDIMLCRLNSDGTKDLSFGNNGLFYYDISGTFDGVASMAVLPDQKILLLVNENHRIFLIRLLPDGTFDPDFGLEGLVLTAAKESEYAQDLVIQPDQKILVLGSDANQSGILKGMIRRFDSDGSIDATFGNNGYKSVTIDPTLNLEFYDCILQPDGKILATGYYAAGAPSGFPVVRFNEDGNLDPTFSGDGIFLKTLGLGQFTAYAEDIALQPDGKIVVSGYAPRVAGEVVATVIRLRPDGTIESGFGSFGVARVTYTFFASATNVIIQPDNKILLGGYCYVTENATYATISRLNPNGTLDVTFGTGDGKYAHFFGGPDFPVHVITDIDLDKNGKLVETLWRNSTTQLGFNDIATGTVLRYLTDITVGAHEAQYQIKSARLSPNLVADEMITLEYTLDAPTEVSVSLFDLNGRYIANLVTADYKTAGIQTDYFYLPAELPTGSYVTVISGGLDYQTIPIVKTR